MDRLISTVQQFGDPTVEDDAEIIQEIVDMHNVFVLTPPERAATLEVIAALDSTLIVESDPDSGIEVSVDYGTAGSRQRLALVFDNEGWLRHETLEYLDGIPTVTDTPTTGYDTNYDPPVIAAN